MLRPPAPQFGVDDVTGSPVPVVIGLVFINSSGPLNQSPHLPGGHRLAQYAQAALMAGAGSRYDWISAVSAAAIPPIAS
jgi:hypothetical protein